MINKMAKVHHGLAPDSNEPAPHSIGTLFGQFKKIETNQGFANKEPNWPKNLLAYQNMANRPHTYNSNRNISGMLGGDTIEINFARNETTPIIGLAGQKPIPFLTETHRVQTSESYTIILLCDSWRENYKLVADNLEKGLQGSFCKIL